MEAEDEAEDEDDEKEGEVEHETTTDFRLLVKRGLLIKGWGGWRVRGGGVG